jgi:tripartite-type tricarboxylate transporter receptor subunit TctC
MNFSIHLPALAAALFLTGCATTGQIAHYPTQPVRIIVPYPEGNVADTFGRIVAGKLAEVWGQPVTVENRPGGVTVPGVDAVAKSKPDGHTLLVHSVSYAVNAGLYTNLPYDSEEDLVAVVPFARQPFVLAASPVVGAKNVANFVASAKAKPGQYKFASLGETTQVHFVAEQFKRQAGIEAGSVVYKGVVDANAATAKGEVAFWFPPVAGAMAGIKDGKLVPLAVTSGKRSAMLPQVPTLSEAGIDNMESAAWFGMWAPAGTAPGVINKISKDVAQALRAPDVLEKFAKAGAEPLFMTPTQFASFVRDEIEASRRFVKQLGIEPQSYTPSAK